MDFADLYTRYAQDVFRFAFFLSGNRALAARRRPSRAR